MDVNGTRFHLVREPGEWLAARTEAERLAWDETRGALILEPNVYLFEPRVPADSGTPAPAPLDAASRRGAAADRHGTVYWIDEAGRCVWRRPPGGPASAWWCPDDTERDAAAGTAAAAAGFRPTAAAAVPAIRLRGLAVTERGWLIVGTEGGPPLMAVDLVAGGPPMTVRWPDAAGLRVTDLEAAPEGGVWILDGGDGALWRLDATFAVAAADAAGGRTRPERRARTAVPDGGFRPPDGEGPPPGPEAFPPAVSLDGVERAVALAALPDGSVLVLDSPASADHSTLHRFRGADVLDRWSLDAAVLLADDDEARDPVHAYDVAWVPDPDDRRHGHLVLVASSGDQAFRWSVDLDRHLRGEPAAERPAAPTEYLPLRRHGGAELVVRGTAVLYDFRDRWVELRPAGRPRYAREGSLRFVLDGREEGCVWHRLALDGCIPPGTSVEAEVRAADRLEDLGEGPGGASAARTAERHRLYLRGDGSELPFHGRRGTADRNPGEGTWETLLRDVVGRWAEVVLRVEGTGLRTPSLRALRVHYPRFSYLHEYLPEIWREDPVSTPFTDRWLANFEGLLTTWEGRIVEARRLWEPSAAPDEALEWLAGWMGIVLDPHWSVPKRRLFLRHVADLYRWRGTAHGVEVAVRLFLEDDPGDTLFDPPPRDLRCRARSTSAVLVRVVEAFRTRRVGRAVAGLDAAPDPGDEDVLRSLDSALAREHAHRFSVLVPADIEADRLEVVRRIVELARPAHTSFDLEPGWSLFRVGGARLGMDTELESAGGRRVPMAFAPAVVGAEPALGLAHAASEPPFDASDRVVPERDRHGFLPPL